MNKFNESPLPGDHDFTKLGWPTNADGTFDMRYKLPCFLTKRGKVDTRYIQPNINDLRTVLSRGPHFMNFNRHMEYLWSQRPDARPVHTHRRIETATYGCGPIY